MATIPADDLRARSLRLSFGLRELVIAGACLSMFYILAFNPRALNDGDTYWHLRAGAWMLDHGRVPNFDPFSFTHLNQPWVPHEWLSEIIMTSVFRLGGWTAYVILFGFAGALSMGLLLTRLSRWFGPMALGLTAWLAVGCMWVGMFARPHLLALPIMIYWTGRLIDARSEGRAPPLWLALVLILWANLHGSFVFGALVAAPLALEALWEGRRDPWPVIRDWGGFAIACLAAVLLTPNGVHALTYPFQIMTMKTLNGIVEWLPSSFAKISEFQGAILLVLLVCLSRGVKMSVFRVLLLLVILHMALTHQRHTLVLAVIAPLLLAEPIGRSFGREAEPLRAPMLAVAVFAAGALVLIGLRTSDPVERIDAVTTPKAALAHVPAALRAKPVLNTYSFGGYLIFSGIRPFIDGRSDMYGDAFFTRQMSLVRGDQAAFDKAVKDYGLAWTILAPREPLAKQMDAKPGWTKLYGDRWAVVHARTDVLDGLPASAR